MDDLTALEQQSIYILREAYARERKLAALWSAGKDSTAILWMCRKAFLGKIPFPVLHLDTAAKFPEMYEFRDRYAKEWGLDLRVVRNEEALAEGVRCGSVETMVCCHRLKTQALQQAVGRFGFRALLLGIRRDEHGIRAKERYFSPRDASFRWDYRNVPAELWDQYATSVDEETHMRVHPLLHWTEREIWEYTRREGIPVNPLYLAKNGERYRSLGCMPNTKPIPSGADTIPKIVEELARLRTAERAGRAQDKEANMMQRLRALGYM